MKKNNRPLNAMLAIEAMFSLTVLFVFAIPLIDVTNQFVKSSKIVTKQARLDKRLYQALISRSEDSVSDKVTIQLQTGYASIEMEEQRLEIKKISSSLHLN